MSAKQVDPPSSQVPESQSPAVFRISPLIRLPLFGLYLALTLPLPFLAQTAASGIAPGVLWLGIALGGVALYAALSDRVLVDEQGIQITYPAWVPRFYRQGWSLSWADIQDLKPRSTGQGGLVYYLQTYSGQAYLLPMRVVGFAQMMRQIEAHTGIATAQIRPIAQVWMYLILSIFTLMLLGVDGWTIWTALSQGS